MLFSKNIIFDSYNGLIFISGFDQSTNMNGISDGEIKFIASTQQGTYQYIKFDDVTSFTSNTNGGISIIGYNGISIYKNITSCHCYFHLKIMIWLLVMHHIQIQILILLQMV